MIKLLVVVFCVCIVFQIVKSEHTIYGNVDVDDALEHDEIVNSHFKCLIGTGMCTKEDEAFKQLLPEALKNKCAKCTANEKEVTDKVIKYWTEKRKDLWEQIVVLYNL